MSKYPFPMCIEFASQVPIWCVTPQTDGCIHRFFDTSPFSPSGRYIAVTRFLQESKLPQPGERAEIILVDLQTGQEQRVAETYGWESQLGANINWGPSDEELYFNDVNRTNWEPKIIQLNPLNGVRRELEGSIYRTSPNGKQIISACAKRMRRTQDGYGVVIPDQLVPRNYGLPAKDGLYVTDTETGKKSLLISIEEIFKRLFSEQEVDYYQTGECYGFHCKFNPQGDRLLFSMRWMPKPTEDPWNMIGKGLEYFVVTMTPDGSDLHLAVGPKEWRKVGHHINWFPDGKRLSMNLCLDDDGKMYFVEVNYDGSGMRKMVEDISGSGHPTLHPNGKFILTDAYEHEGVSGGDGTVPLRWIDLEQRMERTIVTVPVHNEATKHSKALRVDPHPAWDFNHQLVAFNGFINGTRRVFMADFSKYLN